MVEMELIGRREKGNGSGFRCLEIMRILRAQTFVGFELSTNEHGRGEARRV